MAAHTKDDGRPAAGDDGRAEAEGDDQGAISGEGPAVTGDVRSGDQVGQEPEDNAGQDSQQHQEAYESGPILSPGG